MVMRMTSFGAGFTLPSGMLLDTKVDSRRGASLALRPSPELRREAYRLEIAAPDMRQLLAATAVVGLVALGLYIILSD